MRCAIARSNSSERETLIIITRLGLAGESGLGKSTLVNTLFNHKLYPKKEVPAPHMERPKTVAIESISAGECMRGEEDDEQYADAISPAQTSRRTASVSSSPSSTRLVSPTLSTTMRGECARATQGDVEHH